MEENEAGGGEGGEHVEGPSPIEQEALRQGWSPQEKFHGKPEDWVDAETFVQRGKEINAVLKKQLQARDRELAALRTEMAGMKGTVAELAEYRANLEKTVYDRAMSDLRDQLKQAKINGDVEREFDVMEAIEGMKDNAPKKTEKKTETPAAQPTVEPQEFINWKARSPWYNAEENPKMVRYADGVAMNTIQEIQRTEGRTPSAKEILTLVDEAVREMFPQAFSTKQAAMFESGGGAASGSGAASKSAKGFNSIPQSAKDQFQKFYDAGYYIDMKTKKPLAKAEAQAEYFKDYNGG